MQKWHTPAVDVAIITHRRPTSLRRLLNALACAHYLGDTVDVAFSLEAGADAETVSLARTWAWPHGVRRAFRREAKGGLVTAVVESWFPSTADSYGLMLEDDIEVSPYFYVYLKALLLRHAYAVARPTAARRPNSSVSHCTRHGWWSSRCRGSTSTCTRPSASSGGGSPHAFAQQLPCSWGQLFFPRPGGLPAVHAPPARQGLFGRPHRPIGVLPRVVDVVEEVFIEMSYLRGYVVLYPNLYNQTSLSTNHLGRASTCRQGEYALHKPIDFTVPSSGA